MLEGVMMMGKTCTATAVRDPDGQIQVEAKRLNTSPRVQKAGKIPFVRGVVNMVSSLVRGTSCLMRSAAVYGEEEEAGVIEKWLAEKLKISLMSVVSTVAVALGVVIAVALFLVLPNVAVTLLLRAFPSLDGTVWQYLLLGIIKLAIFFAYLGLVLLLKDIRRLYRYHGAEHKTITCYENGLELTPENVMKCSRLHARCGTSFLFIVVAINIFTISLVNWGLGVDAAIDNSVLKFFAKLGIEIVLLPIIAGVSYEFLKLVARFNGKISLIFKAPGFFIQKVFTTREPDEEMAEVAIAAFKKVLEMDADPSMKETEFVTGGILSHKIADTKNKFAAEGIDESDAEWIYSLVLGIPRSRLSEERIVTPSESKVIAAIIEQRLTGRPLWYIIGDVDFCGCKIKVDERVLIPRPETEELAQIAIRTVEDGDKVLDMCTGSGCIAIAIAKACAGKRVSVTAADISDAALMLAAENANYNSAMVQFVQTDLFENIRGRYNIIVCNPPYIKSEEIAGLGREVREFEPRIALDGGIDGLDYYRRLAMDVNRYIAHGGMLILEVGDGQVSEVLRLFEKRDYAIVIKDLEGQDRFLKIAF